MPFLSFQMVVQPGMDSNHYLGSQPRRLVAGVLGTAGLWWICQTCKAARSSVTSYHSKGLFVTRCIH